MNVCSVQHCVYGYSQQYVIICSIKQQNKLEKVFRAWLLATISTTYRLSIIHRNNKRKTKKNWLATGTKNVLLKSRQLIGRVLLERKRNKKDSTHVYRPQQLRCLSIKTRYTNIVLDHNIGIHMVKVNLRSCGLQGYRLVYYYFYYSFF